MVGLVGVIGCGGGTTAPRSQEVELNYGEYAIVTHQQISDAITESLIKELTFEDYDYKLKKVIIEDKKISVYLDLHFVPPSKRWIVDEGKSWVQYIACLGLYNDNGNFIGNVYATGYDVSCSMWTWYEDTNEVIPWGHAIIFNSGRPFDFGRLDSELHWIDGAGMKMFE